jgi:hypothetical protein
LLGGILLLRRVLSGILDRRWLGRKCSAWYISRRPRRRIAESAAKLGGNRPCRERGAYHDQECADSSHDGLVSAGFCCCAVAAFCATLVNMWNAAKTGAPDVRTEAIADVHSSPKPDH